MALNGLFCADVPLRIYSLTHSYGHGGTLGLGGLAGDGTLVLRDPPNSSQILNYRALVSAAGEMLGSAPWIPYTFLFSEICGTPWWV